MEYYHCSTDADQAVAATFKVLVLGNSNVGKTSLIKSYSTKKRPGNMMPTIGVDYTDVVVTVRGTTVKLRIWDTAGQEKFHTFTKQFFRGTQGVLLVYDITTMDSFRTLQKWDKTLREEGLNDVSVVIVGNKADLEELRVVPREAATQFASQHYKTQHIETSVHRGTNVKRAFHMLAENLIFSHNIFQPGQEATAKDDSCGDVYGPTAEMFSGLRKKLKSSNLISRVEVKDVRFPTSKGSHGSDAIHKDPDYSAAYVILSVQGLKEQGHGLTFTLGRGTEVVVTAVKALSTMLVDVGLLDIFTDFGKFWHKLTNESQLRWIGPEKGVVHLATAAIVNALWDLWGKIEGKPVWKLLSDLTPEEIVSVVDFTHLTDELTKEEALAMLRERASGRGQREADLLKNGYPLYITSIGWLGYTDSQVSALCKKALAAGFKRFKMKVGLNAEEDARRAALIRNEVGWDVPLMMDANQVWDVSEAVSHMTRLAEFKPLWIEEPTSPDDIMGHAKIGSALKKFNIGIATGEMCQNKVMFKQFLATGAMDYCQIDAARLGGINEIIAVILMANKFGVPVCPHAGGVGLCEYVIHLSIFDYICVSGTKEGRMTEYAEHLHDHFMEPAPVQAGEYWAPQRPGYSQLKLDSMEKYSYPDGQAWKDM